MRDTKTVAELETRAALVIELAKRAGATDVFATATRSREVETEMRAGKLEKVQEATSRSVTARLWVDGRFGSHSTSDLRPDRLEAFVTDAVTLTGALQPDPDRSITDPALYEGRSDVDLELLDPTVRSLAPEARRELLQAMQARVDGADHLISATSGVYDSSSVVVAQSTNGFTGVQESGRLTLGTTVTLQGQGDKRPEAGMWATARHRSDLLAADEVAGRALDWALDRLGADKGATANTTMLVHPRAAGSLLRRLLGPASGSSVQQGRSYWADRLGKPAVSEALGVTDDPLIVRGLGSRHFDGEGIAARRMPIVTGGALQNLFLDTTYASKLDMAPTTGGPSNLVVQLGSRDLEALIGATSRGYLVTRWLGGNMDSTTGDFSYGVQGFAIDKGARAGSVGEMNITGNMLDLFSRLAEVGDDPWPWSSTRVPTLVFEGVQFSGT